MTSLKRKRLNSSSDERAANTVQSLHADGSSRIQVGNSYTEVHNHEGRHADDECLRDLRTTDPRVDKKRIEKDKGGLMHGSYDWVLEDSNFQQWTRETEGRLLWVNGDPGKGKTMLLCGLIDELEKPQYALSYFFCQATDSRINNATSVLRGLIYLLVDQEPSLKRHIRTKWNHGGKSTFDPPNGWHVLCNMLNDMLRDHSEPIWLVIDALDECEGGSLSSLLNLIVSTASEFHHVRWLVSSRNLPSIERGLGGANPSWRLDISLEANAGPVSRAVADYIGHKVSNLANLHSETELRKELQETMQDKANGTFLWAALVFDKFKAEEEEELEDNWEILKSLNEVPQGLSSLYARMWTQITSLPSTSGNLELFKRILATMFLAYQPLQLQELALLADLRGNFAKHDTLVRLVRRCGSFLSIQQGTETVHFVHQSAKDFLRDNKDALDGMFPSGMGDIHHELFSRSVDAMDTGLRQNIYGLRNPGVLTSEIETPVPDPLAAMRYSCVRWLDHFCGWVSLKQAEGQDGAKEVATFLQRKYLYWLESLGLCGSLTEGILSIRKLEALATRNRWDYLAILVHDAHRFVLTYKRVIEIAPLQVYVSALIFCPTSSWIRERFKGLIPEWIKKGPKIQPEWDACLLTLEGHGNGVGHLAFSPDSRIIASSDGYGIIKIWDAHTGACLNTISDHRGQIIELAFLSGESSTILASAEFERRRFGRYCSIKIWDPFDRSTPPRTFPMPNEMSNIIAFLADSKTAVWVDMAGTLIKFDLDTGKPLEEIRLPAKPIAVSPDGQTIITQDEGYCQVWDWRNPKTARLTLDDLSSDWYDPVAISSDCTKLVGSRERPRTDLVDIEVWDLTKGTCIASHSNSNMIEYDLACSPDGRVVAFADLQGTVNLWHTITDTVEAFSGHSAAIMALAISPDGRLLAAKCEDKTIKIWDPTIRTSLSSKSETQPEPTDCLLSPNGLWVASLTNDNVIRMWSSVMGKYVHRFDLLEPPQEWTGELVQVLEFSPCDRWLALKNADGTTIWDTTTWEIQELPHRFPRQVYCVSLSTNTLSWLTRKSDTVEIWDLHTRKLISTFFSPGWDENFAHMSFSPNGLWLALVSWGKLEIWDWAAKECIQVANEVPSEISWHSAHEGLIHTFYGSYCVHGSTGNYSVENVQLLDDLEEEDQIQMTEDGEWVAVKGKRVLWVPSQYQPRFKFNEHYPDHRKVVDCTKSGVAILDNCNRVICIDFDVPKTVLNF